MLEIFIPIKIKEKIFINNFSEKLEKIIRKNFEIKNFKKIETRIFSGIFLELKKINFDLIILSNWEFWEFYFLDYDLIKYKNLETFWTSILRIEQIEKNLKQIEKNIDEIMKTLKSNKLLTTSKKQEIEKKINKIFFTLSWILFILHKNKNLLEKNNKILEKYKWLAEYEAQARLLKETSKTKKIQISANLEKFENMVEIYLETLEKIFV